MPTARIARLAAGRGAERTTKRLPSCSISVSVNESRSAMICGHEPERKRLIADCGRMAADLDQEVRNEEDCVKIHDSADVAYSTYAKASASRRDNLRRSAHEFKAHLAKAEKALLELGEATLDAERGTVGNQDTP